ncbi:MAG: tetratricopeptide repeat protein [Pirellula sp.]
MSTLHQDIQLAQSLVQAGKNAEAESVCVHILKSYPDHGDAAFLLGIVAMRQARYRDAVHAFNTCLISRPQFPEVHSNLGVALANLGLQNEALRHFELALSFCPTFIDAAINQSKILCEMGREIEASALMEPLLQQQPGNIRLLKESAYAWMRLGRYERAVDRYRRVCQLKPDDADSHWNLATCELSRGNFLDGWSEYAWRWKCQSFADFAPKFDIPQWTGESIHGKRILLNSEQGHGDTIQFIRYASILKQHGAEVLFHCPPRLETLLSVVEGIDETISIGAPVPECDFRASLMDLPAILGSTLETVPARVPYLDADPIRIQHWRTILGNNPSCNVGIAWHGSTQNQRNAERSIPLIAFAPLASIPGVRIISLQKGAGSEQLSVAATQFPIEDLAHALDIGEDAFVDTAALMKSLDLVVTCDTAIAHLAGALGIPVWMAIPKVGDWRWMVDRTDSPWYPTMRIFRQTKMYDWTTPMQFVANELSHWARR